MILYLFYNISSDYDSVSGICDDAVADLPDNLPGMFMIIMIINDFNMKDHISWLIIVIVRDEYYERNITD